MIVIDKSDQTEQVLSSMYISFKIPKNHREKNDKNHKNVIQIIV